MIDSKFVASRIRARLRPILKEAGFSAFTTRKAWLPSDRIIQVVDFRSMGAYLAGAIGSTPHSFAGNVGVYYTSLELVPWGSPRQRLRPEEFQCQARLVLAKRLPQINLPRSDIWYVDPEGASLDSVIDDAARAIDEQALPWLSHFSDITNALLAFETQEDTFMEDGIVHQALGGTLNSLARVKVASALALVLGDRQRALTNWQHILHSPFYQKHPDIVGEARRNMRWIEESHPFVSIGA